MNEIWIKTAENLNSIKEEINRLSKMEDQFKEELKALSNNKSSMGGRFAFICTERKGNVDYSKIPELEHVNVDIYRKPPTFAWQLKVVEGK